MTSKKFLKSASASLPFKLNVTNILLLLLAGGLIYMALKSAHIIEGAETLSPVTNAANALKKKVAASANQKKAHKKM